MRTESIRHRAEDLRERARESGRDPYDIEEGRTAREIEKRTARVPSDVFLWAAGASVLGSAVLQFMGRKETSNFVGQWAPTLLLLGVYNKLVKQQGHD